MKPFTLLPSRASLDASFRMFAAMFLGIVLAACGGGGGAPSIGGNGTVAGNGSIKLALTDASGAVKSETSATSPLTAKATVLDNAGRPVVGKIVSFSLSGASAVLNPSSGSVMTDDNGVAQVTVTGLATGAGALELTASVTVGTTPVTAKQPFTVVPQTVKLPSIQLTLLDGSGVARNSLNSGAPLVARATVLDDAGQPLKNTVVTFTINTTLATLSPVSGTALTDTSGIAQVNLLSTDSGAGAAEITASVAAGTGVVSAKQAFSIGAPSAAGNGTIRIALFDGSGNAANLATTSAPLSVRATITDDRGAPLKDKLVTFTLSSTLASLAPASGTALSDANGIAQVSLLSNGAAGAGEVTATAQVGTTPISTKIAFSVGASPTAAPVAINFIGASPSNASIVIRGAGGNGRTEVALLTYKVVDSSNNGLANVPVSFSTGQSVTLAASSGITDQNGLVTVALSSGNNVTSVRVTATVTGTSISTLSDQVTVTTGLPIQAAFSLALEKFYLEAMNTDGVTMTVSVSMGDANGGAVADGTPVVFTTDAGVIIGNGGARCLTVQGACSVTWRSQNPRPVTGIGTINASSAGGTGSPQLAASSSFYLSGSYATVYSVTPASVFGATSRTNAGGAVSLNFASSCATQNVRIEVVDSKGNPMPEGSTLTIVNPRNVSATVSPAKVSYGGSLKADSSTRGTIHDVTIGVPNCVAGSTKSATGYFDLNVTTPGGTPSLTRFWLGTYPYNSTLTPE